MKQRSSSGKLLTILSCSAIAAVSFDLGFHAQQLGAQTLRAPNASGLQNPSIATCPTSNCPAPPLKPVLSSQFIHGSTTKGPDQPEWLSNIGLFVKTGTPDGQKVAQYIGVMQQKGAGTAWALNTDLVRNAGKGGPNAFGGFEGSGKAGVPGSIGDRNGSIGYELDFTNWDAASSPGRGAFTVGEYVHAQGSFTSLAAIYFDAKMADSNDSSGWDDGLLFNGDRVVKSNTIADGTHSLNTLLVMGEHKTAVNTTLANDDIVAVQVKSNQKICFDIFGACLLWKNGNLIYNNHEGKTVFSVDEEGNASFAGHVISH